jgi:ferredoxin
MFRAAILPALLQNLSPAVLLSTVRHSLLWFLLLSFPLIALAFFRGRFFCWHICPVGLLQDLLPSRGRARLGDHNRAIFVVLLGFALVGLNLLVFFDPLVIANRAASALGMSLARAWIFVLPLIAVIALSLWRKRFWCFKLCPLGAFFDWVIRLKLGGKRNDREADIGRRNFLLLLGAGIAGGLAARGLNARKAKIDPRLIRPPGALPENDFTDRCVRCGACMAVCLTKTLQPTLSGAGWEGIFAPRLVPRIGECDEFCNRCGQSCPTQAIRAMPLDVKRTAKLGAARVAKERCLAWSGNKHCLVCQEFCPYLAIKTAKNENGTDSPVVVDAYCRGCGMCERHCRSDPIAAIMVYNDGAGTFAADPPPEGTVISD